MCLLMSASTYSQNQKKIEIMPDGNTFPNIKANFYEARTGLMYYPSNGYFKIDAGDAVDILSYYTYGSSTFTFGSEFLVTALGLNIKSKRLPIDAADGYFGIYFSYSNSTKDFKARLRILHNSAHIVDGHLNRGSTYSSIVDYVKDFVELTIMHSMNTASFNLDYYAGTSYSIVIHPKNLKRFTAHAGLQTFSGEILNPLFGKPVILFCSYHFSLSTIPAYVGNNRLMSGIRFGKWESSALTLYLSYYIGSNIFNQYYNQRVKEFSIGFFIN